MAYSPLIYSPGGAALEYCPAGALALNPFEGLCPFSCHKTEHGGYNCYANQMAHQYKRDWPMRVKENLLERLEREAARKQKQGFAGRIHVTFACDGYVPGFESTTRQVLEILKAHGLAWQVLTKRPSAALADLDLYDGRCWLGATITGQPGEGGDPTAERVRALTSAWGTVKTWVSAEPLTMAQREYVVQGGLHDFIAFGVDRSYPRADAEDLAHAIPCLMKGRPEGWYLKRSLRKLLTEGPFEGNLRECGWNPEASA